MTVWLLVEAAISFARGRGPGDEAAVLDQDRQPVAAEEVR
jgi:hypothetical protein